MIKMNYAYDENINCCRLLAPHCGIPAHCSRLFHLFKMQIETQDTKGGNKSGLLQRKTEKHLGVCNKSPTFARHKHLVQQTCKKQELHYVNI